MRPSRRRMARRKFLTRLRRRRQRPPALLLLLLFFWIVFPLVALFCASGPPSTLPLVRERIDFFPWLTVVVVVAAEAAFEPCSSRFWRRSLSALINISSSKNTCQIHATECTLFATEQKRCGLSPTVLQQFVLVIRWWMCASISSLSACVSFLRTRGSSCLIQINK